MLVGIWVEELVMIKWPVRAAIAIKKLFEPLQDIDVYVEDENDEVFYRTLINTVCHGSVRVSRIFGLGGRKNVLDKATAHKSTDRRALFIIDGDLEWVRGLPIIPSVPWIHQHEAYCVENLLLCEDAFAKIVSEEILQSVDDAKATFDFQGWRLLVLQSLVELFAVFGASNELCPHVQTVSMGVMQICNGGKNIKPAIDPQKVAAVKTEIQNKVELDASPAAYSASYNRIHARISALRDPLAAISGKNFLLPLIIFRLQGIGCRINKRTLRMRLVSAGDMKRFFGAPECPCRNG
jgi:hypothetical protein